MTWRRPVSEVDHWEVTFRVRVRIDLPEEDDPAEWAERFDGEIADAVDGLLRERGVDAPDVETTGHDYQRSYQKGW